MAQPLRRDFALSAAQKMDAREALAMLEGSGLTLTEAARRAVEGRRAVRRLSVQEVSDLFLRAKLNGPNRSSTAGWYMVQLDRFGGKFGQRFMDDLPRAEFRSWLDGLALTPGTQAAQVRALRALFRWAAAQEPPLAGLDVTTGLPSRSAGNGSDIAFLSVDECAVIMNGAGRYRAALALMMFAGVRPEEVSGPGKPALLWRSINVKERIIRIPAEVAKTRRARLIEELPIAVWQWLGKTGAENEPICPARSLQAIRRAKAVGGYGPKKPWVQDVLRHTFATYHVAAFSDPGKCAMLMGHEGNPTMLHRHYRGLATKADALRFWALRPIAAA